ncbi:fasciclin domain-containing protein [Anaerotalea alkaliphila]|uniref:Fasciclin domain-containing protein n=1 Tax=Anaerotalea alkaliphila TaxID=2662126 RepID=A0A7X5KMS8_9FIRM|nr:fasciclin domain-containing protein [Anaerotalea alkaliphila]NDL67023.1 fasciclin domain-containing protein [Anaerotalea alkaliphila]
MKRLFTAFAIASLLFSSIPLRAAEGDIVDIASGNPDFSILVAALQQAELVSALQGEGPFTVFAPTDAAFTSLLNELGITAEALLANGTLSNVLLYHVVSGKVMSTDLSDGMSAPTLNGEEIYIDLTGGVKVNASKVVLADLEATNGVIHVVDKVLVPSDFILDPEPTATAEPAPAEEPAAAQEPAAKDIVEIALGDQNFSMLVSLLQKAGLVETLQGEGPFTVFAPTNAAFDKLLAALGITPEELMAQPDLAKVLLYHVVLGKVMSTDLSDGLVAATAGGESIAVDLKDGVKINQSNVTIVDIEASNGVIHVIDTVLVPAGFTLQTAPAEEARPAIPYTGVTAALPLGALFAATLAGYAAYRSRRRA